MTPIERMIALGYLERRIKEELASVRQDVRAHYHDRSTHEVGRDGEPVRSFGYHVNGQKVASFYFREVKGHDAHTEQVAVAYDWDAILADDNPDFAEWLAEYVKRHIGELAEEYVRTTGDLLDGVSVREVMTPAEPPSIDYSTLYFKPNVRKIEELMRPTLPEAVAGLLEGGA